MLQGINRLLRQQQDSKALSASGGTTTADHGEKSRRPLSRFEGNYFTYGRKDYRADQSRSAKKKIEKSGDATAEERAEVGASATSVGGRSTLRINNVACAEA